MEFMIKDAKGGLPLINGVEFKQSEDGSWIGGPVDEDTAKLFDGVPRFTAEQVGAAPTPAPAPATPAPKPAAGARNKPAAPGA